MVAMPMHKTGFPVEIRAHVRESAHRPGRLKVSFALLDDDGKAARVRGGKDDGRMVVMPLSDAPGAPSSFRLEMN